MKALVTLKQKIAGAVMPKMPDSADGAITLFDAGAQMDAELDTFASDEAIAKMKRTGLFVVIAFFVFFGGWAALSQLESAVMAYGVVSLEGQRKAVQHAEGGIVQDILVKEGQLVRKGQVLIQLDKLTAQASLDIQNAAADSLIANIARLEAERSGAPRIAFPKSLLDRATEPQVAAILKDQRELFAASSAYAKGQTAQALSQIAGYEAQIKALDTQYKLVEEELEGMQSLYEKGYATKTRVLALQRGAASILGQREEYAGNVDRLRNSISRVGGRPGQVAQDTFLKINAELNDSANRLAEVQERQRVLRDQLARTAVRAPVDGHVLGLAVFTPGAVIPEGGHLMDIVPVNARLTASAKLKPVDGERVTAGMEVEMRLMSVHGRNLPPFRGKVTQRSADILADPKTGESFYTVTVLIDHPEALKPKGISLEAGTPLEMVVPTGSRSALQYMVEPITLAFHHGLKE